MGAYAVAVYGRFLRKGCRRQRVQVDEGLVESLSGGLLGPLTPSLGGSGIGDIAGMFGKFIER